MRYRLSKKPGQGAIVTVFADPRWSLAQWNETDESLRSHLIPALERTCGQRLRLSVIRHHRWKFARLADPAFGNPRPMTLVEEPLLMVSGEAFGVSPDSPAGLLSAQASARLAARILSDWGSGRSGPG